MRQSSSAARYNDANYRRFIGAIATDCLYFCPSNKLSGAAAIEVMISSREFGVKPR